MKNVLLQPAMKLNKNRKRRKGWQVVVRTLAVGVVFCTTYALILPAITIQADPECGFYEHVHMDSCFQQPSSATLGCTPAADAIIVHRHNEYCLDETGKQICTLQECSIHTHEEGCYTLTDQMICQVNHVHDDICAKTHQQLICQLPEGEAHTHSEDCSFTESVLICNDETHEHSGECYDEMVVVCELLENEGHIHGDSCYTLTTIPCEEPTAEEHIHEDACYQHTNQLTCAIEELRFHIHEAACYDVAGSLICTLPLVVEHNHDETCLVVSKQTDTVLICELQEHVHVPECYPVEEETTIGTEYICGYSAHSHSENCFAEDGTMTCTIPEHSHEAACIIEDLDMTADAEVAFDWETELARLDYTGIWAEDLLTVAKSQLGYRESARNVVMQDGVLEGYSRYGAWSGEPYGDWNASFTAFCLNYAGVDTMPVAEDASAWINKLTQAEAYVVAGSADPKAGDLVFFDYDLRDAGEEALSTTPDRIGILAGMTVSTADTPAQIKVIEGDVDGAVREVAYDLTDKAILGYGVLPENPLSQEEYAQARQVKKLLTELPSVEAAQEAFQMLQSQRDKAGHEALRQELIGRLTEIDSLTATFNDRQKAICGDLELVHALKELCGGALWQEYPALEDDGAVVTALTCSTVEILRAEPEVDEASASEETAGQETAEGAAEEMKETEEQTEEPDLSEKTIQDGDSVTYGFTLEAQSYYTDICYGSARAKVELVLPMTPDSALFDTEAITWLEDSSLSFETRTLGETLIGCQVLTGWVTLEQDEKGAAVPGSFTGQIPIKVLDMAHSEKLSLVISAAMEHNTWDGMCPTHEAVEKLTVQTEALTMNDPLDDELRNPVYRAFLTRIQMLSEEDTPLEEKKEPAKVLLNEVVDAYYEGLLDPTELETLGDELRYPLGYIAEYATGTAWMIGSISNIETNHYAVARNFSMRQTSALTPALLSTVVNNQQQIKEEGGEAISADGAVRVSKTIEGTEYENVFDITLQIQTQDEVHEVYEEPDMAVVVVMDISRTMISGKFDSKTRYQAALEASADFLYKFAENNKGASKVGFVAFNTHGHEVFPVQQCSTADQVSTLVETMQNETMNIMYGGEGWETTYGTFAGALKNIDAVDAKYSSRTDRYTNMEAGLQAAYDMLEKAENKNKYIIFLSDGFPTTYMSGSEYRGYNPETSSGTKDTDGVFYDDVRNVYCNFGTSYSDTAAIRARQLAVELKELGVNIFSIGVDVGGQNLWDYHNQKNAINGGFSVVERRQEASYYRESGYEIGTDHDMLTLSSVTAAQKTAMAQDFKNWLKGTATTGIGSGYYYDSTNTAGLQTAFDSIFEEIKIINAASSHLDWVATDPMSDMGVHEVKAMEFISFWDLDENGNWVLVADNLTGESKDGNLYDNTADFHEDTQTIHWDIKKSGYISQAVNNVTNYLCELRYRVRLRNEDSNFVERQAYNTNDVTSLTYRIIDVTGGVTTISEQRTVEFPIPAVEGYLSELKFLKTGPQDKPLMGAEFKLSHAASCNVCRGDGISAVSLEDMTATSDQYGYVTFSNIPSGHTYTLTETKAPDGYIATTNAYQVVVSYDALTVTVTDADGNTLNWDGSIWNDMYYVLPNTGGSGTLFFTFGGLLTVAAAFMYLFILRHKLAKGGKRSP